jgi:hypothetical protein
VFGGELKSLAGQPELERSNEKLFRAPFFHLITLDFNAREEVYPAERMVFRGARFMRLLTNNNLLNSSIR